MSTMARPTGRLPARVYWVRRSLVLALALGLVFGVAQLIDGGSPDPGGDTARVAGADTGADRTRPAAPRSTADAEASPKRSEQKDTRRSKPTPTKTPLVEPSGPCEDDDIVVTPKVRGEAHAGSRVRFRLKLTTLSAPACTWTVSAESVVVKLTSGDDRIWSSQDCPRAIPETDVVVRRELPAKVDLGWRGQRSDGSCSRTTSWAQPGWYHVTAAAFGAEPTDAQFELREPVPETITPSPEPEKSKKADGEKRTKKRPDQDDARG